MAAKAKAKADDAKASTPASTPLVRGRMADLGAILSGLLYFVAFAGFDQWWLTFVCLVPLYVSLHGQTTKRATWLGFLTGLAMNLGGFYWLLNMLKVFSGFPTALCILFVVIICSYQALRLAFMGWLFGRATTRGWPVPVVFASAFAASCISTGTL
jgi:apolipoprotein N-acyltransferase